MTDYTKLVEALQAELAGSKEAIRILKHNPDCGSMNTAKMEVQDG